MFNLLLGFIIPNVDNFAHIGGLVTGLVMGFLFAPDPGADAAVDLGAPRSDARDIRAGVRQWRNAGDPWRRTALLGAAMLVLWTVGSAAWG